MSLATSSLPVPLSPRTRTLTPRGATRSTRSSTCRMTEVCATMRRPPTSSTSATAQHLVLFGQSLALGEQALDLAQPVDQDARERGHRLQEPAILFRERRSGLAARLLVEDREVAEEHRAVLDRCGEQVAVRPAGEDAVAALDRRDPASAAPARAASSSSRFGRGARSGQPTVAAARGPPCASRVTTAAAAGSSTAQTRCSRSSISSSSERCPWRTTSRS